VRLRQDAVTAERHDGSVEVLVELEVRLPPALGVPAHQLFVHDVELRQMLLCHALGCKLGAEQGPRRLGSQGTPSPTAERSALRELGGKPLSVARRSRGSCSRLPECDTLCCTVCSRSLLTELVSRPPLSLRHL
jgi:hypothetical protein